MLNAEGMFYKLGYKKKCDDLEYFICYERIRETKYIRETEYIGFNLRYKEVYFKNRTITVGELNAIKKQCEELGWIESTEEE